MKTSPPTVTQAETVAELLDRSKRGFVPIRHSFLQQGSGKVRDPGPLSSLVRRGDERGLDFYLLVHAAASSEPFDVTLASSTWARALGIPQHARSNSANSAVSKVLRRLADLKLVTRARKKGRTEITLLDEGGGGEAYEHPVGKKQRYLKLPYDYWTHEWQKQLGLPGKFALLVALSLRDDFILPIEKGPDWYGVSADTVQRGLAELQETGLLEMRLDFKKAALESLGYTKERHFTLAPPFGPRKKVADVIELTG